MHQVRPEAPHRAGEGVCQGLVDALALGTNAFAAFLKEQHGLARFGKRPPSGSATHPGANDDDIPNTVNDIFHGVLRPVNAGRSSSRSAMAPPLLR